MPFELIAATAFSGARSLYSTVLRLRAVLSHLISTVPAAYPGLFAALTGTAISVPAFRSASMLSAARTSADAANAGVGIIVNIMAKARNIASNFFFILVQFLLYISASTMYVS